MRWDAISLDWQSLFVPDLPILEAVLRISVVYLFLFFLFRVMLKREAAALSISDLLVVTLVADAVQNAMSADYTSITDGLVLAATLVFWNWFVSYAAMRWSSVRRVVVPAPLLLIRDGEPIWHNLRHEHLTDEELLSHLRLQGLERIEDVKYAFMEPDGRISAIPNEERSPQHAQEKKDAG